MIETTHLKNAYEDLMLKAKKSKGRKELVGHVHQASRLRSRYSVKKSYLKDMETLRAA